MRVILLAAAFAMAASGPVHAQVDEGPLKDPSEAATPAAKPSHAKAGRTASTGKAVRRRKSATQGSATPAGDARAGVPAGSASGAAEDRAAPTSQADRRSVPEASDPVSFGMKWNGNNDTAERTRVQNYNGDAAGTGAEVGLKLHF